ncbi:DUF3152 domain-containing protein [Nocardioides piscis]|uniref:DUF3152 domain-containing protein n=1 Tax=Nocardioides piscis TaxID=2714938 RepID=A0A6G7YBQ3_9ACTN|nr:DUF3152 domain-containing protein [Nocardioides piscis]QIK74068.1 DUF3152 domain-containing protein [Nocardioides piscis]
MPRALLLALLLVLVPAPARASSDLPPLTNTVAPAVDGTPREGRFLRAHPGRWTPQRTETRYRWLRDGEPIPHAADRRHRLTALDVGARITVEVRARSAGHRWTSAVSRPTSRIAHGTPVRRRVTYSIATRGRITTSVATFRRQAQETYADARGWRAGGIAFRRVARGGDFTLVLAEASSLPSFGAECSTFWSCRVGRFVVINQDRWKFASPAWNQARAGLRDYRHLVVNHETGHWLGHGHRGCTGPGQPAPVMMQQSKGLDGCRFNPWPTPAER